MGRGTLTKVLKVRKRERAGEREGETTELSGHMKVVAMASRPGHISIPESYLTESFLITTAAMMTNSYISFIFL